MTILFTRNLGYTIRVIKQQIQGKTRVVFSKKVRDPDEKFDGIDEGTDI